MNANPQPDYTDPTKPWLVSYTDTGMLPDMWGGMHTPFQGDRRIVVLSLPHTIDLSADAPPSSVEADLIDVVADAMERPWK